MEAGALLRTGFTVDDVRYDTEGVPSGRRPAGRKADGGTRPFRGRRRRFKVAGCPVFRSADHRVACSGGRDPLPLLPGSGRRSSTTSAESASRRFPTTVATAASRCARPTRSPSRSVVGRHSRRGADSDHWRGRAPTRPRLTDAVATSPTRGVIGPPNQVGHRSGPARPRW